MVRLDPFFSFGFSSVYQHGWVFDIFGDLVSHFDARCHSVIVKSTNHKCTQSNLSSRTSNLVMCRLVGCPDWTPKLLAVAPNLQHIGVFNIFNSNLEVMSLPKKNKTAVLMIPQKHMGVSKNRGTPKSSILIRFSIINNPFWGTPIFGNIHMIQTQPIIEKSWFKRLLDSSLLSCLHFGLGWSCHQCPVVNSK